MHGGASHVDLDIPDRPLDDGSGRYWRHLASFTDRTDEADAMGHEIDNLGTFMKFDEHETGGFFSLRSADDERLLTMEVSFSKVEDVRGPGSRPATAEEWTLAHAVAQELGDLILILNGFSTEDPLAPGPRI